jgi:CheY-like chemotaxis protein
MDGYETTKAIRLQNFHNPIIALSANAFDEHIQKSIDAGMNGHLSKPFTPEQIYHVVSKHMADGNNNKKAA